MPTAKRNEISQQIREFVKNLLNRAHNEIETIQKKIEVSKRNGLVEKVSFLCTVETKMMTIEQKRWKSPKRMENLNEQEQRQRN